MLLLLYLSSYQLFHIPFGRHIKRLGFPFFCFVFFFHLRQTSADILADSLGVLNLLLCFLCSCCLGFNFLCIPVCPSLLLSGPLIPTQMSSSTTPAARPVTSSAIPSTMRPLPPTAHPIGAINKAPDLRPITATVPVTRRPLRVPPQDLELQVCEARVARGVQWPATQRGETVDRPCPKGSLGE